MGGCKSDNDNEVMVLSDGRWNSVQIKHAKLKHVTPFYVVNLANRSLNGQFRDRTFTDGTDGSTTKQTSGNGLQKLLSAIKEAGDESLHPSY